MIIHSYDSDEIGNKVYLDSVDAVNAFYKVGANLVVSTVGFFSGKYSLIK